MFFVEINLLKMMVKYYVWNPINNNTQCKNSYEDKKIPPVNRMVVGKLGGSWDIYI